MGCGPGTPGLPPDPSKGGPEGRSSAWGGFGDSIFAYRKGCLFPALFHQKLFKTHENSAEFPDPLRPASTDDNM